MGTSTASRTAASAVLRTDEFELSGVLDMSDPWTFSPTTRLDGRDRLLLGRAEKPVVMWGENAERREMPVEVRELRGELISLRVVGKERRVQRRKAVRAPLTMPCRVLVNGVDDVTSLVAETIDVSATGTAVMFSRESRVGDDVAIPADGLPVGLILQTETQRIGAVAQVMGSRRTEANRVVVRLRFDQIRRADSDTIQKLVLKCERSRLK